MTSAIAESPTEILVIGLGYLNNLDLPSEISILETVPTFLETSASAANKKLGASNSQIEEIRPRQKPI